MTITREQESQAIQALIDLTTDARMSGHDHGLRWEELIAEITGLKLWRSVFPHGFVYYWAMEAEKRHDVEIKPGSDF